MTNITLTHKSKEFAERMLETVMGEQSINDTMVRAIMFDCYTTAYKRGFDAAFKQYANYKEDMGR